MTLFLSFFTDIVHNLFHPSLSFHLTFNFSATSPSSLFHTSYPHPSSLQSPVSPRHRLLLPRFQAVFRFFSIPKGTIPSPRPFHHPSLSVSSTALSCLLLSSARAMIFHFLCPHQNFHLSIPGRTLRFRHVHDILFCATQHLILSRCLSSCQLNAQTEQNSGEKLNPERFHVSKFTKLQVIFHRTCQGLFRKFSGSTRNLVLLKNLRDAQRKSPHNPTQSCSIAKAHEDVSEMFSTVLL